MTALKILKKGAKKQKLAATWVKKLMICAAVVCSLCAAWALPAYASGNNEVTPRVWNEQVLDTYKSFHNGLFYVDRYDLTYRLLTFPNSYSLSRVDTVSVAEGYYGNYFGYITTYKCIYDVW